MPVFAPAFAQGVAEIDNPAILLVPADFPHPIKHRGAKFYEFGIIITVFCLTHDEPGTLDGMPGVQHPSLNVVQLQCTVRGTLLHHQFHFRTYEIGGYLLDQAIDEIRKRFFVLGACLAQFLRSVEQNHRDAKTFRRGIFLVEFWNEDARGCQRLQNLLE